MKKKVLLSSIATIALCLCLIAGSTFALFTDKTEFNIAVTSGDVEIKASAGISAVYSAEESTGDADDKYLVDEHKYNYTHVPQSVERNADNKIIKGIFSNGGDATIEGANLVINRITPGDRVDVDINVENKSNVAIAYRYKMVANNTNLARGMVVTLDAGTKAEKSYEAFAGWTSEWFSVGVEGDAGKEIPVKTISVELPVYAGNEYQSEKTAQEDGRPAGEQNVTYTITVEAVQGNAVTENEAQVLVYPTMNAVKDALATDDELLSFAGAGELNFEELGTEIDKGVYVDNTGEVHMRNGTIAVDAAGLQNSGEATLTDMNVQAGNAEHYGVITTGAEAETVLNKVEFNSAGGGIGAADGAKVIFNSGSVDINSTSTSGRYLFYAEGKDTEIIINDGNFDFNKSQNQKRAYVCAMPGSTVYIKGGTFGKASTRSGYSAGILTKTDPDGVLPEGKVIITGGTFGFDPSNWVDTGYQVVEKSGVYYVLKDNVDPDTVVNNADLLIETLEGGNDVLMMNDVNIDPAGMSNAYGTTGINVKNGQTIDGGGNTLDIKGAGGTWDSGINTTGGLIKNLTVTGSFRGIFINHNSTHTEKVVLENVIIDGTTYTISCDQGDNQGFEATNSTFNGWTSYAATLGNAKFTDCNFGKGNGYAYCRPYAPTEFVGCNFEAGFRMDARAKVTFENCTLGGVAITAENVADLVTSNTANATVK